jgi:hypothetical protein
MVELFNEPLVGRNTNRASMGYKTEWTINGPDVAWAVIWTKIWKVVNGPAHSCLTKSSGPSAGPTFLIYMGPLHVSLFHRRVSSFE